MERTARVRLAGGPKDGWVYDVVMHWELTRMGQDVEWRAPRSIDIKPWPSGESPGYYAPNGLEEDGALLYDWVPRPASAAAPPGTEPPA